MYKILLVTCTLILGCGGTTDMEKEKLLKTDREFALKSRETNPATAFNAFLLKDALMLPNGGAPIKGRKNIFELMNRDNENRQLDWWPEDGEVAASLDFGYTWGNFVSTTTGNDGTQTVSKGKYLNVWKKNADGQWRVLVDMGNKNP